MRRGEWPGNFGYLRYSCLQLSFVQSQGWGARVDDTAVADRAEADRTVDTIAALFSPQL
jgi:hypothetical protein